MSIEKLIYDFNTPALEMTPEQQSLVGFILREQYSIAVSPRQTGISTALYAYIAYMMENSRDQTMLIIFKKHMMRKQFQQNLKDHLDRLQLNYGMNVWGTENKKLNNIVLTNTVDNLESATRGSRINHLIFDDWNGRGQYTDQIQQSLPHLLAMLSASDGRISLLGTSCGSFVDTDYPDGSLMACALRGKSHFNLWNFWMTEWVDELAEM